MVGVGRSDAAMIIICWRLSFSYEMRGCSHRMISIFRSFRDDDPLCLPSQCVHSENHIWIFCIIKWIANMWCRFLSVCVREEYNSTQTLYFDLILLLIQLNRIDYLTSIWINSKLSISLNSICLFPNEKLLFEVRKTWDRNVPYDISYNDGMCLAISLLSFALISTSVER